MRGGRGGGGGQSGVGDNGILHLFLLLSPITPDVWFYDDLDADERKPPRRRSCCRWRQWRDGDERRDELAVDAATAAAAAAAAPLPLPPRAFQPRHHPPTITDFLPSLSFAGSSLPPAPPPSHRRKV